MNIPQYKGSLAVGISWKMRQFVCDVIFYSHFGRYSSMILFIHLRFSSFTEWTPMNILFGRPMNI